jgi:hypothetical protein
VLHWRFLFFFPFLKSNINPSIVLAKCRLSFL